MVSWYLASIENKSLNLEKILKYALVHDLPEVYASDTPLYTSNYGYLKSEKEREINSIFKIKKTPTRIPKPTLPKSSPI